MLIAVLLTSLLGKTIPTKSTLWSCVCISLGFLVTSADVNYANLCLWGYFNGCVASLFGCLYLEAVQWVSRSARYSHAAIVSLQIAPIQVLHNTMHMLLLLPAVALLLPKEAPVWCDLPSIIRNLPLTSDLRDLVILLFVSGLFVTVLPFCTVIAIRQVSPLTLVVAGYVKSCLQMCCGWILLGESITPLALFGVGCVFLGSGLYARSKRNLNKSV